MRARHAPADRPVPQVFARIRATRAAWVALISLASGSSACGGSPPKTAAAPVAVRGGTSRFIVAGGAVVDRKTGITWQRRVNDTAPTFAAAKASCEGLSVDGRTFRLPTLDELKTLVDERLAAPTLDHEAFPDTQRGWFFTATPFPGTQRFVWAVSFEYGGVHYTHKSHGAYYRCVSAAPPETKSPFDERTSTIVPLAPNATVLQTQRTNDRVTLRIAPKGWALGEVAAGQSVLVGLPGGATRSTFAAAESAAPPSGALLRRRYAVVSSPKEGSYVELAVSLQAQGALSPRLHALGPGDSLWLSPTIAGRPLADRIGDRHAVFFATGIGIAHFVAYLRGLMETKGACEGPHKVALIHGATRSDELIYRDEFTTFEKACKAFTYIPTVQKPELETPMWAGSKGTIAEAWARKPLRAAWGIDATPQNTRVTVCGSPELAETVSDLLLKEGFTDGTGGKRGEIDWCGVD